MYKLPDGQLDIYSVYCPLEQLIDMNNRWVRWSREIPWTELELSWAERLYASRGAPAKDLRKILGAYLIKEKLHLTERETVNFITENPYLQYFIGLGEFTHEPVLHHTLLGRFARRLDKAAAKELQQILKRMKA